MTARNGPGLVIVDKPAGMTSHDVVGRCRRIFATRKVGHAGTLDPMATGVLVIGIDRATKILGLLTGDLEVLCRDYPAGPIHLHRRRRRRTAAAGFGAARDRRGDRRRPSPGCAARSSRSRRRSARSRSAASGPISWPARGTPSNWPPGRCASTGSRCWPYARHGQLIDRRRRGGLFVGDLYPRPGPRSRRRLGGRRPPDRAAAHPGRPVRAGPGALARRAGRPTPAELHPRRGLSAVVSAPDLSAEEADAAGNGRALTPAGIDGVYAAHDRRRPGDRAASRRRPADEIARRNPPGHAVVRRDVRGEDGAIG